MVVLNNLDRYQQALDAILRAAAQPSGRGGLGALLDDDGVSLLVDLISGKDMDADGLEALVNQEGGLKAVSGLSGDLRLLRDAAGDEPARLAIEMYVYSVRKQIAAMVAALEGVDLVVFTGGIGQNDAQSRAEIRDGLRWLGRHDVRVLTANEEEQIARHAIRLTR